MSDITTIPVSKKFHDWLKSKGKKGESYEDILKRLIGHETAEDTSDSGISSSASSADELLNDNSEN